MDVNKIVMTLIVVVFSIFGLCMLFMQDRDAKVEWWPIQDPLLRMYEKRKVRIAFAMFAFVIVVILAVELTSAD